MHHYALKTVSFAPHPIMNVEYIFPHESDYWGRTDSPMSTEEVVGLTILTAEGWKQKDQIQPVYIYKAPTLNTSTAEALHQSSLDSVHLHSSSSSLIPNQIQNVHCALYIMPRAWWDHQMLPCSIYIRAEILNSSILTLCHRAVATFLKLKGIFYVKIFPNTSVIWSKEISFEKLTEEVVQDMREDKATILSFTTKNLFPTSCHIMSRVGVVSLPLAQFALRVGMLSVRAVVLEWDSVSARVLDCANLSLTWKIIVFSVFHGNCQNIWWRPLPE